MITGALLFTRGVQQFVGRHALRRQPVLLLMLAFAAAHAWIVLRWGAQGRHVLLNGGLGVLYFVLALVATPGTQQEAEPVRAPLRMLVALMGTLAVLTLGRSLVIATQGVHTVSQGPAAQIYYAYASLAAVLLGPNLLWMVFVRLNLQLVDLASHDPLTRTLNRNGLDEALRRHFDGGERRSITWLQVDIDHFKRINDQHGHPAGDAVLRAVAAELRRLLRAGDFVARTGGEEFLIGCVGASVDTARKLGERLREAVAMLRTPVPGADEPLACTVSIGISQPFDEWVQWEPAVRTADQALYAAKAGGRNRVVLPS
jgi:diguanylate cyclase (GGDEF)-like protein